MKILSKTKLLAFRQCPKRLWLEVNHPELGEDSARTKASFADGNRVGELARQIYDPAGIGHLIDIKKLGVKEALVQSQNLIKINKPIFEAGFTANSLWAFADVLVPKKEKGKLVWDMIEVKSSTSVKDYYRDDVAIQAYIAKEAGLALRSISLAYINTSWVYGGNGDYCGLLIEEDLTQASFARGKEVEDWAQAAQALLRKKMEPKIRTGNHCSDPYECRFIKYCQGQEPQAEYPVTWLGGVKKASLKALLASPNAPIDMREIADEHLNETHQKIKAVTLSGKAFIDKKRILEELSQYRLPALFLDFETITRAAPSWKGTRPYQQIPFQFSVHRLSRTGKLEHDGFLQLDGKDPSKAFAKSLIEACPANAPIFVYNAAFEGARIQELAQRFPRMAKDLLAIHIRLVDLYPIARKYYYHPKQQGSWSIKKVLPALVPSLKYSQLEGVQDGGMAMGAFLEATDPATSAERQAELYTQLEKYCELDTYAMVKIWQVFAQRKDLGI